MRNAEHTETELEQQTDFFFHDVQMCNDEQRRIARIYGLAVHGNYAPPTVHFDHNSDKATMSTCSKATFVQFSRASKMHSSCSVVVRPVLSGDVSVM